MGEELDRRLLKAAENCNLAGVETAIRDGADVNANDGCVLIQIAGSKDQCAFDIVRCFVENHANIHFRNDWGNTALTEALRCGNYDIANRLLSLDDFLPGDVIPRPDYLSFGTYKAYRKKAILRTCELVDKKGIIYARTIAMDIEQILKSDDQRVTREDIEALQPLVRKIALMDWMSNAQVTSADFQPPADVSGIER